MIRRISHTDNLEEIADLVRKSFITVTEQFSITKINAPTNPAYIGADKVKELVHKCEFYSKMIGSVHIGTVAIEKSGREEKTYYIEKLGVHPKYRHEGIGRELMNFAFQRILELGGIKASIGIINEHTVLKYWYVQQGFTETGTKKFEHLPFTVCFMEKLL